MVVLLSLVFNFLVVIFLLLCAELMVLHTNAKNYNVKLHARVHVQVFCFFLTCTDYTTTAVWHVDDAVIT